MDNTISKADKIQGFFSWKIVLLLWKVPNIDVTYFFYNSFQIISLNNHSLFHEVVLKHESIIFYSDPSDIHFYRVIVSNALQHTSCWLDSNYWDISNFYGLLSVMDSHGDVIHCTFHMKTRVLCKKKCYDQLSGARSTQKLVEIHNTNGIRKEGKGP